MSTPKAEPTLAKRGGWNITIPDTTSPENRWFRAKHGAEACGVEIMLGGHGARTPLAKRPKRPQP